MISKKTENAFSLVEVLWGVFLLATAIVVIVGVIISALQAIKKSEAIMEATLIMTGERGKFIQKGYAGVPATPEQYYIIDNYYVIYQVDTCNYPDVTGIVTDELKIVTMGVYNVPPEKISITPGDRLVKVKTNAVLFYEPDI